MTDAPRVQEGIWCSHGVQGPYACAGEPIANCGERGSIVHRLIFPDGHTTEWAIDMPCEDCEQGLSTCCIPPQ